MVSSTRPAVLNFYKIERKQESVSSIILFIQHRVTKKRLVIKILRSYWDERFDFRHLSMRQKCQIEALHWNKKFTPGVYIGLSRIYNLDVEQANLVLGEVIGESGQRPLEQHAEYGLLMRRLPGRRRLDQLLEVDKTNVYSYAKLVIEHIAKLHGDLLPLSPSHQEDTSWGSYEQLGKKLRDNLRFFDRIFTEDEDQKYKSYSSLKDTLFATYERCRTYFKQRQQAQQIKRCHGDIKSTNIWIPQYYDRHKHILKQSVKLLDAIDFNVAFSNIDVLSDFAMFVVDVQARTWLPSLASAMVKDYLKMTGQESEAAFAVLRFYLIEKAMISATIAIAYDNLPELGLAYLEAAVSYTKGL